jgi:hypothetical protein
MVHALKKVTAWMVPGGYVIVMIDLMDPPLVEVQHQDAYSYAGRLLSSDDYINEIAANAAVDSVIQSGTYTSFQSIVFEYNLRGDSLSELLDYMQGYWSSAYFPNGTRNKVEELVESMEDKSKVVLKMISRIVKLKVK